jgi:putative methyltransferase (TIGR04325 family)
MSYAYALAIASFGKRRISLLDWGGGLGQYGALSRRLFPELEIEYHCADVEPLARSGEKLQPQARFHSGASWAERRYDLVLASCSLHYVEDWRQALAQLAGATLGHLFVTRLPTVRSAASFVQVQRPYRYGFETEYPGWCLNRAEFLSHCESLGLRLLREFVTGERPPIFGAPEACEYRGYLLKPA